MQIDAVLDSSIHLNTSQIPKNVVDSLLGRLKIPNPARKVAEREMLRDAHLIPEHLKLWKYTGPDDLLLPRGFIFELEKILGDYDIRVDWENNTSYCPIYLIGIQKIDLRVYQERAVEELVAYKNGIYRAPTGAGKSRVMLEVSRRCKQKTIIFCEKTDIATQWIRAAEDLEFKSVGFIGEQSWNDEEDLTIALRQSVWAKRDQLDNEWFEQFGMAVIDECHHCVAQSMFELIQRFPAYYRYGCSATPDSDQDLFPIARAVIGPVVASTPIKEIGDHLIKPSVRVVKTEFSFPYRPTERRNGKVYRNNYNSMMSALEKDGTRNQLIAKLAIKEMDDGHSCLIVSKRKKHLDEIFNYIENDYNWFFLTGDNSKMYSEIAEWVDKIDCTITLSTLADEGTDIPRWDRLFLSYPGRKLRSFEQAIGRIMRPHPKKKDAIVYDFRDANVSLLNSQYRDRCQNIYHKREYKIEEFNG